MTDDEILEQRAHLIDTINRLDREWDEYRTKYAGVPEYWEVQRNAFNEISALRSHLADLPLTSKEKRWRLVKIVSAIGVVVVILIWVLNGISMNIKFLSIFTWKSWLITSSIIAIIPATGFILFKRKEDGFFDPEELQAGFGIFILAFLGLMGLKIIWWLISLVL